MVLLALFASGAEHQSLTLCRYLSRRCRVTLLTNDEFANQLAVDPFLRRYSAGLSVVRLGRAFPSAPAGTLSGALHRAWLYPPLQLSLWRALRRLRPPLIHLILAPSFFAYAPLFYLLPYPVVVTLSGEMRYVRRFYGLAKRLAVRHAAARADALVVCSPDELANLEAVSPLVAKRAVVLDNFTDVHRFAPGTKAPLVTFAARLHPEKGALLFVEAAARVRRARPDVRFALLGRGEQADAVERRLEELGLQGVVERGFVTDLAPWLARSSVFVSCQLYENLGSSSLLEAMASANAIVATDVGQTWRIIDETVGRRVPVDAGAIAAAIIDLLSDPGRLAAMGVAARRRVVERFGPEPYVERLLALYARVACSACPER